jgi:hypothetical protein
VYMVDLVKVKITPSCFEQVEVPVWLWLGPPVMLCARCRVSSSNDTGAAQHCRFAARATCYKHVAASSLVNTHPLPVHHGALCHQRRAGTLDAQPAQASPGAHLERERPAL